MGLERLVAVMQDKISNYDTDLFTHLLDAIQKVLKRSFWFRFNGTAVFVDL